MEIICNGEKKDLLVKVNNKEEQYVNTMSIMYIKAEGHYTQVVTQDARFTERKTMTEWENELDEEGFFRTHKSFIVNLHHVRYSPAGKYILSNGEKIKVSKYKLNAFKKFYDDYVRRHLD
jgi:two-component system LytT family response regulator